MRRDAVLREGVKITGFLRKCLQGEESTPPWPQTLATKYRGFLQRRITLKVCVFYVFPLSDIGILNSNCTAFQIK